MNTWSMRTTVGAIAVAAGIAGLGGAAIVAATDGGYHSMSAGMHGPGGPGGGPPPPAAAHHDDVDTDSLHGQYVVSDGKGGFATMMSQTGRVTAISPTSVTARSDDGFVQAYVIREVNVVAQPPFSINDLVTINAVRDGAAANVTTIRPPLSPGH